MKNHVIIVGGGAAGMTAAISCARMGACVTILEKNPRVGKKILATGNGRCNFTNIHAGIPCYYGKNPAFANDALSAFTVNDTLRFFEELGITHKVEELGKVFPMSDQASSVLDVLLYELNQLEIQIICDSPVADIINGKNGFIVETDDRKKYTAHSVILATGGKAMPSSGSDGNGYALAQKFGHTVMELFPALVQIMLEGSFFKQIDGVKIVGTAEIIRNNETLATDRGDILFANYGVSGPPILQISRKAGELLNEQKEGFLKINMMDTLNKEDFRKLLLNRLTGTSQKPLDFSLVGLVNKRLIPVLLKECGIMDIKKPVAHLSGVEHKKLADIFTNWRIKIRGTKSWPSAQVTAGGINTAEINPATMESRLVKGLYFAGEIIDIDGKCGGFNLQWAWSSGFVAGKNAAQG